MSSANRPATRLATRLSFLVAGFGIACWAPLVPFAKAQLAIDDGTLGLLLLCLGGGSVVAMLLTGILSARYGSKPIIIVSGLGLAVLLPMLSIAELPLTLGLSLFVFGASLGSIDVAMNIDAIEVERAAGRPLMSGFHAFFNIGAFAGSALMTALLSLHFGTLASTSICSVLMLIAILVAWPRLLRSAQVQDGPLIVLPRGIVLLLALLAAITFLVEGAVLDWGALLVIGAGQVPAAQGGLGCLDCNDSRSTLRRRRRREGRGSRCANLGQPSGRRRLRGSADRTCCGGCHGRLSPHRSGGIEPCADPISPRRHPEGDACWACCRGDHNGRLYRHPIGSRGSGFRR